MTKLFILKININRVRSIRFNSLHNVLSSEFIELILLKLLRVYNQHPYLFRKVIFGHIILKKFKKLTYIDRTFKIIMLYNFILLFNLEMYNINMA